MPVFSPSLPEPGCRLFPALGSATPGHPHSWATWNPASRPVSSEPSRPPRLASYACPRSGSMCHCCPHLVLDVTQAPGPVCTLPDTLRTPRTAGGIPSPSHPRCWVSSTPFNHVSLISARTPAAQRPQGAGLGTHSVLPTLGAVMACAMPPGALQPQSGTTSPCRGSSGTCPAAVDTLAISELWWASRA